MASLYSRGYAFTTALVGRDLLGCYLAVAHPHDYQIIKVLLGLFPLVAPSGLSSKTPFLRFWFLTNESHGPLHLKPLPSLMSRGGFRPPRNFSPSNEKNHPEKMLKPLQDKAPTASTKESAIERFLGAVGFFDGVNLHNGLFHGYPKPKARF